MQIGQEVAFGAIEATVLRLAGEVLDREFGKRNYSAREAPLWVSTACDSLIGELGKANPNFKFLVNVVIAERGEFGIVSSCACYWDKELDGRVVLAKDYPGLSLLATVFGVAF